MVGNIYFYLSGDKGRTNMNENLYKGEETLVTKFQNLEENMAEEGVKKTSLMDLPVDLLELIVLRLFRVDLLRLSPLCRIWREIALPVRPIDNTPLLMSICARRKLCSFFDPIRKIFHNIHDFPNLKASTVHYSKDGWLLMSQSKKEYSTYFFFNPFTKSRIQLPDMFEDKGFHGVAFSSSLTSSDCKIVALEGSGSTTVTIRTCCRGDESWTSDTLDSNPWFAASHCNLVFYDDVFYCLGMDGRLGIFDPRNGVWSVLSKPTYEEFWEENDAWVDLMQNSTGQNFLVECGGKLVYVFIGYHGRSIKIFCLNRSEMIWEEIDSMGDQTMFLSHKSSFSTIIPVEGMQNKIFFPLLCGGEDCSVFYSFEDRRFFPYKDFSQTKGYRFSTWIQPSWSKPSHELLHW
ncbi:F-box/kelch-repeat protein At1g57790-like [Tasmannia lanceolata]|uniref:F-box/kelch-repeat protein At1g57790-like n=2 Tax=Tasmannia lanceolata TaxID=3420 RepID=UPI004064AC78